MTSLAPSSTDVVVRVSGFVKRYKHHLAVDGLDFTVNRGEIYGLIGPDGAGKSTVMKAIAGVLGYEGGSAEVFGIVVDSERAAEQVKRRIGFLPQGLGLNLYPELSVEENIDFFARLRLVSEADLRERKARLLAITRLERFRTRLMKQLSGGMKQKLGLICTLIHEPELAILDEPTTGVDPVSRRDFWAILTEWQVVKGMTALVSTAYMDEAARFHRLSFLSHGQVLASGTPSDVRALVPGLVVTVEATPQLDAMVRLKRRYPQVESMGASLHVFTPEREPDAAAAGIRDALDSLPVTQLHTDEPELEDVVVALLLKEQDAQAGASAASGHAAHSWNRQPFDGLAVQAKELIRDFDSFRAVDRVSFDMKQGEIFGLLGANGAGKTTVIKMLTGILPPTGGEGRVAGADMRTASGAIKERIGYMSQAFSLYLDLTVIENIRLFAGIYGLARRQAQQRMAWIVDMAGLGGYEHDRTGRLPMGVRQRLALGCALVHSPRVLFLDEPTSGVDPIGRRRFWEILSRLAREEGVAILITTHYLSEAEHCDRLALMYAGRIVAEGTPAELKTQVEQEVGHLLEIAVDKPGAALAHVAASGFPGAALFGTKIHVLSRDPSRDEARLREVLGRVGIAVAAVRPRMLSLEDVFVSRVMALEQAAHKERTP
ncbi:MAG: ABC transporter ATP-binding protein [Nitrospira sp.]|jgi:ABC-2 type transport system ATP-binding protein|nr:ABC transporter ATP-binding protein [Nitrospira sp.]MBS0175625.1 ABC transporter ATP-binding protein [Nitrospira sp.]MBS0178045.1 ABC transporter ATP-binding protein [Nitrospira sp.]MBX3338962.1 ABC transporter ATP-binding protein [Nitrospira sp.]MCW5781269.1 ABC transporter ATP-binding protein [Nitrospira sp.]